MSKIPTPSRRARMTPHPSRPQLIRHIEPTSPRHVTMPRERYLGLLSLLSDLRLPAGEARDLALDAMQRGQWTVLLSVRQAQDLADASAALSRWMNEGNDLVD